MKVMIAEDDTLTSEMVSLLLIEEGHEVQCAADAAAALVALKTFPAEIVLCDLYMPLDGGHDLIRELYGKVPVIVWTAAADHDIARIPEPIPVLRKPVEPRHLLNVIQQIETATKQSLPERT